MDPVHRPRRHQAEREDHLARFALAAISVIALLAVAAQYYLDYRAAEQAADGAHAMQAPPTPRVIYRCVDDDGRHHDQQTPCVFERPPVAEPRRPADAGQ
ncbi:hypothetical protein [Hydrocarboniphaga sp.]|uniref:hypothetical protein n=1 Tax=Hydrocarboniphaga sp. TaxID=2033016 RepID=UPI003D14EEE9